MNRNVMGGNWLIHPLPLRERVGRGAVPASSTLRTRRLVVPRPPLPQGEREPEVPSAKGVIANSTVLGLGLTTAEASGKNEANLLAWFKRRSQLGWQGVDARRATPSDPRLAHWGLAGCRQLDPSHAAAKSWDRGSKKSAERSQFAHGVRSVNHWCVAT